MLIRVVDLETTGFEPPEAGVCEIGWCNLEQGFLGAPLSVGEGGFVLVNPGHPITPATSAIHHIVDEDVLGAPSFAEAIRDVLFDVSRMMADRVILAAHSAKFERQCITEEHAGAVEWICTYKCALRLWPDAPLHSNQGLRYWRRPEGLDRSIASVAHRAYPDAYVTAFHLRDMLALASLEDLITWSSEPALQIRCGFGRDTRGMKWTEVEESFLYWVAARDFDEDVLFTVRHEIDRREKERKAEVEAQRNLFRHGADDGIPF